MVLISAPPERPLLRLLDRALTFNLKAGVSAQPSVALARFPAPRLYGGSVSLVQGLMPLAAPVFPSPWCISFQASLPFFRVKLRENPFLE